MRRGWFLAEKYIYIYTQIDRASPRRKPHIEELVVDVRFNGIKHQKKHNEIRFSNGEETRASPSPSRAEERRTQTFLIRLGLASWDYIENTVQT